MPHRTWKHWIPFYVFFKKSPTAYDLAMARRQRARLMLDDAELSVVEAKAELQKQTTICSYLSVGPHD